MVFFNSYKSFYYLQKNKVILLKGKESVCSSYFHFSRSLFAFFKLKISHLGHVGPNATRKRIQLHGRKMQSKCSAQMKWCKLWTQQWNYGAEQFDLFWPKWTFLFGRVLSNATMTAIQCDLGLEKLLTLTLRIRNETV